MKRSLHRGGIMMAAVLASSALGGCSSRPIGGEQQAHDPITVGTVSLNLVGGDGIEIQRVDYVVTNAAGTSVATNHIDLADPEATLTIRLTLPAGNNYTIRLTAQTTVGTPCEGSAVFNVVAGATQQVSVDLVCEGENDGNNTGDVVVNGQVVSRPGTDCPDVAFLTAAPLQTRVGGTIALYAGTTSSAPDVNVGWAASSGTLASATTSNTTYTCTAAGTATLTFSVSQGARCRDSEVLQVTCVEAGPGSDAGQPTVDAGQPTVDAGGTDASNDAGGINYCDGLGSACHNVDPGTGPLHDCHELGHAGDQGVCQARRTECIDLCGAALCEAVVAACHPVDPGTGPLHDCHELAEQGSATTCFAQGGTCLTQCQAAGDAGTPDGGASDAGSADAGSNEDAGSSEPDAGPPAPRSVTIRFKAEVSGEDFACGRTYAAQGTTSVQATPSDLRFFVQDLRLINAAGQDVPVAVETRTPWQVPEVSLIDFEDGQGACGFGNPATNTVITGTVPAGNYTGVAFRNGIPPGLNHGNPATAPAPLSNAPGTLWAWAAGYKFLLAELTQVVTEGQIPGLGLAHVGSTNCTGNPQTGQTVTCAKPMRNEIRLSGFDPDSDEIVIDVGTILASDDIAQDQQCHASGPYCATPYATLGINFANGQPTTTQTAYHVE